MAPDLLGIRGVTEATPGDVQLAVPQFVCPRPAAPSALGRPGCHVGAAVDLALVVLGPGGPDHIGQRVDTGLTELGPQALGQNPLVRLAGEVRGEHLPSLQRAHGADERDGAAPAVRHRSAEMVAEHRRDRAVNGDVVEVLGDRHLEEIAPGLGRCVVDEHADLEPGRRRHHGIGRAGNCQVDRKGPHVDPVGRLPACRPFFEQ